MEQSFFRSVRGAGLAAVCALVFALPARADVPPAEAPTMKFFPLAKNYIAAPRKTLAQKPPLRSFSAPAPGRFVPVQKPAKPVELIRDEAPKPSASSKSGPMTQQQAKLLLSIFEETN